MIGKRTTQSVRCIQTLGEALVGPNRRQTELGELTEARSVDGLNAHTRNSSRRLVQAIEAKQNAIALSKKYKASPVSDNSSRIVQNSGTTATCFGMMGSPMDTTSYSVGFLCVRAGFSLLSLINGSWHIDPNFIHSHPSSP